MNEIILKVNHDSFVIKKVGEAYFILKIDDGKYYHCNKTINEIFKIINVIEHPTVENVCSEMCNIYPQDNRLRIKTEVKSTIEELILLNIIIQE